MAPAHWWPAPAMVISSTVRPAGQADVEVLTVPAVVMTGVAQWSMPRHRALRAGTAGPSTCPGPSPSPRGRAALRTMRATALAVEDEWRHRLGAEQLASFRDTLITLLSAARQETLR
jgi:hypothetical protein